MSFIEWEDMECYQQRVTRAKNASSVQGW